MARPVLAVLGGSFNPPHVAHALLPGWVLTVGGAQRVLVAPCWDHALGKSLAPFANRLAWTEAAMGMYGEAVIVSDIEARLATRTGEPSYTVTLLEAVAEAYPDDDVRLVIGSDIVDSGETDRWHRFGEIERRFSPIVVPRAGYAPQGSGALPQVSSTDVRAWLDAPEGDAQARAALERSVPRGVLEQMRRPSLGTLWVIGSGHVAAHARPWLQAQGYSVVGIPARALVGGAPLPEASPVGVWVLVGDPHLPAVARRLAEIRLDRSVPVLHAAGALRADDPLALGALAVEGHEVGTLHPICALRSERPSSRLDRASFGIEGSPGAVALAQALLGDQPRLDLRGLDAAGRLAYHGACALAANHLAVIRQGALEQLESLGLPAPVSSAAIDVLMASSLDNLQALGVPSGITGPVARGDLETVQRHLGAMQGDARAVYAELSARLQRLVECGSRES